MSEPTRATTYSVFEDRGDGKLYLLQVFPALMQAQAWGRFHALQASNEGAILNELVIIRNEMAEVERIDRKKAEEFAEAQKAVEFGGNVLDLSYKAAHKKEPDGGKK